MEHSSVRWTSTGHPMIAVSIDETTFNATLSSWDIGEHRVWHPLSRCLAGPQWQTKGTTPSPEPGFGVSRQGLRELSEMDRRSSCKGDQLTVPHALLLGSSLHTPTSLYGGVWPSDGAKCETTGLGLRPQHVERVGGQIQRVARWLLDAERGFLLCTR